VSNVVALVIVMGLAAVLYNFGTGRWSSEWTRTIRGTSLITFVLFMPWYVVATGIGASLALVPVAMVVLAGSFGIGYYQHWRRARSRRSRTSLPISLAAALNDRA
jgi:hypothetical protein